MLIFTVYLKIDIRSPLQLYLSVTKIYVICHRTLSHNDSLKIIVGVILRIEIYYYKETYNNYYDDITLEMVINKNKYIMNHTYRC